MNMPKFNMNWIYFVAILTLGMLYLTTQASSEVRTPQAQTEATYTDFKAFVERGYADKIVVNKNQNTLKMYVKAEHIRDVFKQGADKTGQGALRRRGDRQRGPGGAVRQPVAPGQPVHGQVLL